MDGFGPQKMWIVTADEIIVTDRRTGAMIVFSTPESAGKEADKERRTYRRGGKDVKVRVRSVMILFGNISGGNR